MEQTGHTEPVPSSLIKLMGFLLCILFAVYGFKFIMPFHTLTPFGFNEKKHMSKK